MSYAPCKFYPFARGIFLSFHLSFSLMASKFVVKYTIFLMRLLRKFYRHYRKKIHKDWNIMNKGIEIFREFAHIYGTSINDIRDADKFFKDFMHETKGKVNIDFLDTYNWDCIKDFQVNIEQNLIYLLFRLPETDPNEKEMRGMAFPYDTYGLIIKFKNIRFVQDKTNDRLAIVVNGYTFKSNEIDQFIKTIVSDPNNYRKDDSRSFFSTDVLWKKDETIEFMRIMKTPITSLWIIPKKPRLNPRDSEKLLYNYNLNNWEKQLDRALCKLQKELKFCKDKEDEEDVIRLYGNKMRRVAEGLFRLIMCFYNNLLNSDPKDYNSRLLGNTISLLKETIYTTEDEKQRLERIRCIANELSHETGNPVTSVDIQELHELLKDFTDDFRSKIDQKGYIELEKEEKPSSTSFIHENLYKWNFIDEIHNNVKSKQDNCAFRITIKEQPSSMFFWSKESDYLCNDGSIHKLPDNDKSILIIENREDTIKLIEAIYEKIKSKCRDKGFLDDVYLNVQITPHYMKKNAPNHLFTLQEIEDLMKCANDNVDNKLVIDENGFAKIIQNTSWGVLYPVSQETWCAGNKYVGNKSNLSDTIPTYHSCLIGWLTYLETGHPYYIDYDESVTNEDDLIDKIRQYYG